MTHLSPTEIDNIIKSKGKDNVVSRECKHATYVESNHPEYRHDALIVKEWVTFKDGERYPTIRTVEDYKRPYWLTKEPLRTHPEKIHFEDLNRVERYSCRQMDLGLELYTKLRTGRPTDPIRHFARKPYIYGCDFGPEVYLKRFYQEKWPNNFKPNTVTVIDAETNVWEEGFKPILWSEVNDDEIILYYDKRWCSEYANYADVVRNMYNETLTEYMDQIRDTLRNRKGEHPKWIDRLESLPLRIVECDDDFHATKSMVDHLHSTQPDIVTGWNVYFDTSVIHDTAERVGYNISKLMSDPRVPDVYKMAYKRAGMAVKLTAAGREFRLEPQERWDIMLHTASFRICDSMQLYWQLRKAMGKEPGGYGLDAVLSRQIGVGKVKLGSDDLTVPPNSLNWHMEMQRYKKPEYGVYSIFDSLGLKAQELKNNDLSSQISTLAGAAPYERFSSQPFINAVDMHFTAIKDRGKVICTTSDEMETEDDKNVLISREGWIVTFQSHLVRPIGLYLFEDMPEVQSTIYMFGADADVETTYPTAEIIQNLGKEQTEAEPGRVRGVSVENQQRQSINVTGGRVNAIEIMQEINGLRKLDDWADMIQTKYYS